LPKSVVKEKDFDKYKNNVRQNPCCVGSLLQYSLLTRKYQPFF